jgi:DNA-binding NarL/FixJ family response regulator/signal transduction histidine kinase
MWEVFPDLAGTETEHRLRAAMQAACPVEFELYFAPTRQWVEVLAHPSQMGLSISFRDVSERHRAAEDRERSARRQAVVAELGLRALASEDLQALLDEAATVTAQMLDVELVGIAELLPEGDRLLLRAGHGWSERAVGSATSPAGRGSLVGYTVMAGEPVVSEELASDERFTMSPLLRRERPVSGVSVVVPGRRRPFGAAGAFSRRRRRFSADDVSLLQAVANVLGAAVARDDFEQSVIEVKEAERRRIARDLHDEALQDVTDALARVGRAQPASGDRHHALEQCVPALERVRSHLRAAVFDLRIAGEQERPFRELLHGLVESQRAIAPGREIRLEIDDGVPAGPLRRPGTEVLRIVGEALVNARRHSGARHIRVTASGSEQRLRLEVADDGRGFDPVAPGRRDGGGLDEMRERAALLDADLDISSGEASGTRVRLELQLNRDAGRSGEDVRVLLVEDHTAVRQAIAATLEREPDLRVVGQAASMYDARKLLEHVDVAVIDLGLPDGHGADLIPDLRQVSPRAQALVLTANLDRALTARAIERGAAGTLDKTADLGEVVKAVRRLRAGETLMPLEEVVELLRHAARNREQERADRQAIERLTPREREVLRALGEGLETQMIARRLHITPRTARNHVASVLAKLGVHSQLQAVLLALRYGVIAFD